MIEVRVLQAADINVVGDALGLARLNQGNGFYLVAWIDNVPAGHLHLALTEPPELQDVHVASDYRRRGVAKTLISAAESEARTQGHDRMRVSVGAANGSAQALYRACGYGDSGLEPRHVKGPIKIRTGTIEVDEILLIWEKPLLTEQAE